MDAILAWLKLRLAEKSTWAGIATLVITALVSFGVVMPETMQGELKTAVEAIGTVVGSMLMAATTNK